MHLAVQRLRTSTVRCTWHTAANANTSHSKSNDALPNRRRTDPLRRCQACTSRLLTNKHSLRLKRRKKKKRNGRKRRTRSTTRLRLFHGLPRPPTFPTIYVALYAFSSLHRQQTESTMCRVFFSRVLFRSRHFWRGDALCSLTWKHFDNKKEETSVPWMMASTLSYVFLFLFYPLSSWVTLIWTARYIKKSCLLILISFIYQNNVYFDFFYIIYLAWFLNIYERIQWCI